MTHYVMIESRDPFVTRDVEYFGTLASDMAARGNAVTLVLVQDGVFASRKGSVPSSGVFGKEVEILVDSFSLRERGVPESDLHPSARSVEIGDIVDRIATSGDTRVFWH